MHLEDQQHGSRRDMRDTRPPLKWTPRRLGWGALVLGLLLASSACARDYPQTIFEPKSDFASEIADLFNGIIITGLVVFAIVEGILVFTAIKYRRKPTDGLPPQIHGDTRIEVVWTTLPVIVLAAILVPTVGIIFKTQAPAPAGSLQIQVTGHQFWWEFYYPDLGVHTAGEPHMPVGQTVNLALTSADVIHSFWLPALGGKRDANPGLTNYLWWTPNTVGQFPGQCTELCGYSHANMRMRAFVDTPADFQAWVADFQQPAATPPDGTPAATGAQLFQQRGCTSCHTIEGTPAQGAVGPNLTHFASRTTFAGAILENNADNIRTWLKNPPAVKPGSIMPNLNLSDDDITSLTAYLQTLK